MFCRCLKRLLLPVIQLKKLRRRSFRVRDDKSSSSILSSVTWGTGAHRYTSCWYECSNWHNWDPWELIQHSAHRPCQFIWQCGSTDIRCAFVYVLSTCEAMYFSNGLSTLGELTIGLSLRWSCGGSSFSSCLPLKLWTTHTTWKHKKLLHYLREKTGFSMVWWYSNVHNAKFPTQFTLKTV